MKSRTSFSKFAPFKKDLTRFAPVWALYFVAVLLILLESSYYDSYDRFARNFVADLPMAFAVVNCIYAAVCGVMLFGDLYNTRMCYSLHTMPQRRETWLFSHLASGLLFSLVPNLLASVYLMTQLQDYWVIGLWWLLAAQLQFVFFYGVAAVSAILTGNRFAMLAVYAGINFISLLAYYTVDVIYLPMLPGVTADMDSFTKFCPVYYMADHFEFFTFEAIDVYPEGKNIISNAEIFYKYTGLGDGWGYTAIIAVIGLALMGLSVALYRLRHLECAGDFVAFRKLNIPACLIITLCIALLFGVIGDSFGEAYILWMAIGVVVGYFGSLMLIERRIKVFRVKTLIGFGVLSAALAASLILMAVDAFGIVSWTPQAGQVESVTIANYNSDKYMNGDYYYGSRIHTTLTEEEDIQQIIEAHGDILNRMDEAPDYAHRVVLTYKLKNGRTVKRSYTAPADGKNYEIIAKYFYTPENILGYGEMGWDEYVNNISQIWHDGGDVPPALYETLLLALKEDCEAGHVMTDGMKGESKYYLEIQYQWKGQYYNRSLMISPEAENTVALLNGPEILLGYSDWETFLESISWISIDTNPVPVMDYQGLLEAIRQDCQDYKGSVGQYVAGLHMVEFEVTDNGRSYYRNLSIGVTALNTLAWITDHLN